LPEGWYGWYEGTLYTGRKVTTSNFEGMARRIGAGVQGSIGNGTGTGYTGGETSSGNVIVSKLKTASTAAGGAATLRAVKGNGLSLAQQMKSWGALKTLGTIGLGVASFEIGWKVGSAIADLWFGGNSEKLEGSLLHTASGFTPFYPEDEFCTFSGCPKLGFYGYQVTYDSGWTRVEPHAAADSNGKCSDRTYSETPTSAFFAKLGTFAENCAGTVYALESGTNVQTLQVAHLPGESGGSPKSTVTTGELGPHDTAAQAQEDAEECLKSELCLLPGWWWHADTAIQEATVVEPGSKPQLDPLDPLTVRVPQPLPNEVYTSYVARVEAIGLAASPQVLAESAIDPTHGPLEVTQTVPAPDTALEYGATVKVRYNPATAGEAITALSPGACDTAVDPVDIEPLAVPLNEKFPFGIFGWFIGTLEGWAETASPPVWTISLTPDLDLVVDFGEIEPYLGPIRAAVLIVSGLGFVFFLAMAAMKTDSGIASE
jgi:hypothetical protein